MEASAGVQQVRNLTPHAVTLVGVDGEEVVVPPAGPAARMTMRVSDEGRMSIGGAAVLLVREAAGELEHLPEPVDGTTLIVSRLVAESSPDRTDLVFPTDLQRDEHGDVVSAAALGVTASRAGAPDHLVVLVGGNPIPNLQAIATVRPRRLTIVASRQTRSSAANLANAARALDPSTDVTTAVVEDANSFPGVDAVISAIPPGWALCYSGGTKVMTSTARVRYTTRGDGRLAHSFIADGRLRRDDGSTTDLAEGVTLRAIASLHGHRLVGGHPPPRLGDIQRIGVEIAQRIDQASIGGRPARWSAAVLRDAGGSTRRMLLAHPAGGWLEALTAAAAAAGADEVVVNPRLRVDRRTDEVPELDVVVRKGWDVAVYSCTTARERAVRKQKLFEVQLRARQLAGGRARAGLVCLGDGRQVSSLAADGRSDGSLNAEVVVFGRGAVRDWLLGRPEAVTLLVPGGD